jgi:hypothetical protein
LLCGLEVSDFNIIFSRKDSWKWFGRYT